MNNMNSKNKQKWNNYFEKLDVDKDGFIKIDVLLENLDDLECDLTRRAKLQKLLLKRKGLKLDYTDFLTKVIDVKQVFTDEDIINTFKYFDTTNSGTISHNDISAFMGRKGEICTEEDALKLINNVESINEYSIKDFSTHDVEESKDAVVNDSRKYENGQRTKMTINTFKKYI